MVKLWIGDQEPDDKHPTEIALADQSEEDRTTLFRFAQSLVDDAKLTTAQVQGDWRQIQFLMWNYLNRGLMHDGWTADRLVNHLREAERDHQVRTRS